MPANKYALLRYRIIDRCLSQKNYPNKEDLRQACEDSLYGSSGENISESTIEKDLWAMRNESELGYYAPIAYSKVEKGYYYTEEDYNINELSLSDTDLEAIEFAAVTLNQFKDNPLFAQYENAIDKIVNRLKVNKQQDDDHQDQVIQFETTPAYDGGQHLNPLLEAIRNEEVIAIDYQKYDGSSSKTYQLHPYLLKEYRNRWYLIAFEQERNKLLTFGLERINRIQATGTNFQKLNTFDPDRFFKHSIGITELDSEPKKVVLLCSELQANYLQSQPIHPSQKITAGSNQNMRVELEVLETYELIQFILGLGKDIVVIEPQSLRDRITSILQASLDAYS